MTKIKFCGLRRVEDIFMANELLPDFVGFIFAKKSFRYITPEKAVELKNLLDKKILSVGVFVNEEPEKILDVAENLDLIQLHGIENEKYISELKNFTDKKIIKAFEIKNISDLKNATKSPADYILLDGGKGEGKIFDWSLLKNFEREYFLAGGLTVENISEAIKILKPFAVDVSSGIETDGVKDAEKMREFIKNVRG